MRQVPPLSPTIKLCGTLLFACALGASGCMSQELVEGPTYPDDRKIIAVLDIQVLRDETKLTMTNTTARTITPSRAWVNEWWSHDFPGLVPGQTLSMDLGDFKDRFGTDFRAGGFWATQNPDALVKFEVEQGDGMVGFVVIGQ